jgi:hypothetical protein
VETNTKSIAAPSHPFLGFGPGGLKLSTELAPPEHPRAQDFFAYCEAKRDGAPLLRRDAIVPREITVLLPDLFIAECVGDDWLYRLAGGNISARAGIEFTGKHLREICAGESAAATRRLYNSVTTRRLPTCVRSSYIALGAKRVVFEAAQVPILARDGQSLQVFGGMFFF